MTTQESSLVSDIYDAPLVLTLDDSTVTLEQVGGKGASLARMAAAGLPVPPGFLVTTAAYRRFVAENGLQEQRRAAVSLVVVDQPAALGEASSKSADLSAAAAMPDESAEASCQANAKFN